VSAVDSQGRTIWIVDAHRDDGRRFIVHSDEKLSAFVELESAIRITANWLDNPEGFFAKHRAYEKECSVFAFLPAYMLSASTDSARGQP
jgi:hypothetical protein